MEWNVNSFNKPESGNVPGCKELIAMSDPAIYQLSDQKRSNKSCDPRPQNNLVIPQMTSTQLNAQF